MSGQGRVAAESPRRQGWGPRRALPGGAGRVRPAGSSNMNASIYLLINAFMFSGPRPRRGGVAAEAGVGRPRARGAAEPGPRVAFGRSDPGDQVGFASDARVKGNAVQSWWS